MKGSTAVNDAQLEFVTVPEWSWARDAQYGQAFVVGPLVMTCGVAPFDESGAVVGKGDFAAQFRQVVANLKVLLAAAGSGVEYIGRQHVFLRRAEDLPEFRRLRSELYQPPYPASVAVVVTAHADPDMLIEISCEALRRSSVGRSTGLEVAPRPLADSEEGGRGDS
jgi:2-iminobutanoate/2-iminopropanoate deaminase